MKKSLSAFKKKFGKFEISKEQTKSVKGGCIWESCYPCVITGRPVCTRIEVPCAY
jgi:hypothetical protein